MSPCMVPHCEAKGLFPRGVPTQDVPPQRGAGELGRGGGPAVNRGSVCGLAGAGQGQELPGGLGRCQGSLGPAAGPGELPATFLELPDQRERVWAQGKCRATAPSIHCPPHRSHAPRPARPHDAPRHAPTSLDQPPARPPLQSCAASSALPPPCQSALSWALPDTPGYRSLHGQPWRAVASRGSLLCGGCSPCQALMQPGSLESQEPGMGLEQGG